MSNYSYSIKQQLEEEFSMPFIVKKTTSAGEDHYICSPENDLHEFFEIDAHLKNSVRVVVEVIPQLHAGGMLSDMSNASKEKIALFKSFGRAISKRGAGVKLLINEQSYLFEDDAVFPSEWRSFKLRINKAPIYCEESNNEEVVTLFEWISFAVSMTLSLLNVIEVDNSVHGMEEGNKYQVTVNKYERNPINRQLCLAENGYKCKICGFDFEEVYGTIGKGFIHVHHITPVSQVGPGYMINPSKDLIPVCPNCHAMLHRAKPPYTPEQVLEFILNKQDLD